MAMLLAPLAFAGLGYLGFGTTGAAVGWLIGAWLFGPKTAGNEIFDPGAEEMPRFNQSLRGATIPIMFGTNRVASNVVWVKNFQTIRKETEAGGGGKGGGSGMGSKGGGGGNQISYEYKWDMVFHIGMVPEPYGLFGGWSGAQRLSNETINSIIQSSTGLPGVGPSVISNAQRDNEISLTFDDGFFGAGGETNGPYEGWDYFEAQEGVPIRWPHTVWVGFKALSLGGSAVVPQLTWEVGPGAARLSLDPEFLRKENNPDNTFAMGTNIVMVGLDGKRYIDVGGVDVASAHTLLCLDDGHTTTINVSDLAMPSGPASMTVYPVPDTQYCYVIADRTTGATVEVFGALYKINATGNVVLVKAYTPLSAVPLTEAPFHMQHRGSSVNGLEDTDTWGMTSCIDNGFHGITYAKLWPLPDVEEHLLGGSTSRLWQLTAVTGISGAALNGGTERGGEYTARAFWLHTYEPTLRRWLCFYIGKPEISTSGNAFIIAQGALYPNGFVAAIPFQHNIEALLQIGTPEIWNDKFVSPTTNLPAIPFDNEGENSDGSANNKSSWMNPTTTKHSSGALILTWPKSYEADVSTNGSYAEIAVFAWDPQQQTAKLYDRSEGVWFTHANVGTVAPDTSVPNNLWPWFDEENSRVMMIGRFDVSDDVGASYIASWWGPLRISGGSDVLPPYIIYQIASHPAFRAFTNTQEIDTVGYLESLAFCEREQIKVSVQYTREESMLGAVEELLALYGGFLTISDGILRFNRQKPPDEENYTPRVIDNHHLLVEKDGDPPVTVSNPARQDSFNKVRVNFFSRSLDYRQDQREIGDEVDQDFNGVRMKEFQPKFVMRGELARDIAERALWTNLYGRPLHDFKLGRKDADLEPGDVIHLVDSFHPELATGRDVRIVRWEEKKRGVFDVKAVLEIPYQMTATHSYSIVNSVSGPKGVFEAIKPPLDFRMYELPREFQGAQARLFVGWNQGSKAKGAQLHVSADSLSFTQAAVSEPFPISGRFNDALPADHGMMSNVLIQILPTSGFNSASPTFVQTLAIDDISETSRTTGAGVLIAGSEALAMEGLTLVSQNTYRINRLYRGWGGTLPQAHVAGDYWHRQAGGVFAIELTPDKIGTTIYYKVVPYNFGGATCNISSVVAKSYPVRGLYWLPQGQHDMRIFVNSPISFTNSEDMRGHTTREVTSGGCDVVFQWSDAARAEGYGFGGYGAGEYGHFTADVDTHRWRVEIMSGTAVVRSLSVSSPSYTYARATNSSDFNGFGGNFAVRVTPYNNYGAAPVTATRSLKLFW